MATRTITALALASSLVLVLAAAPSHAQEAWVKDEINLQLRTGAGSGFRIIGRISTGDSVEVVSRVDGWTEVRTEAGATGWVPAGFLDGDPPAQIALTQLEVEAESIRSDFEQLNKEVATLRTRNDELAAKDTTRLAEIDRLTRENYELLAGARWPEWITGAGIVMIGMALGAILSRSSGRRRQQRIRL